MNEKIIKIIALTIVLYIVFASAGCIGKDTGNDKGEYASSTNPVKTDIGDKTTTEDDLNVNTVDIDQIQTDISDKELDNIGQELGNIDW